MKDGVGGGGGGGGGGSKMPPLQSSFTGMRKLTPNPAFFVPRNDIIFPMHIAKPRDTCYLASLCLVAHKASNLEITFH